MADFDAKTPSVARVYDAAIGGKDNLESDRNLAATLIREHPFIGELALANRKFVLEAAAWAAKQGVGQFLDLGSGMPGEPSIHETVQAVNAAARVAYVELDPVAVGHMQALYKPDPGVRAIQADLRDPAVTLASVARDGGMDVTAPVCVIMGALVHWFDTPVARDMVARFTAGLAPGSYVLASTVTGDSDLARTFARAFAALETPFFLRPLEQFTGFFDGMEILPPGLVEIQDWQPGEVASQDPLPPRDLWEYVVVARA